METLEQFIERMSDVEKEEELHVGSSFTGHSRAVFCFEGQYCYLEQVGFSTFGGLGLPSLTRAVKMAFSRPPRSYWWTDFEVLGKERCERIAGHYGADIEETLYGEDGCYYFLFYGDSEDDDGFAKLMRFVFDRFTGEFEKLFGA